jgi:hypothetical protein
MSTLKSDFRPISFYVYILRIESGRKIDFRWARGKSKSFSASDLSHVHCGHQHRVSHGKNRFGTKFLLLFQQTIKLFFWSFVNFWHEIHHVRVTVSRTPKMIFDRLQKLVGGRKSICDQFHELSSKSYTNRCVSGFFQGFPSDVSNRKIKPTHTQTHHPPCSSTLGKAQRDESEPLQSETSVWPQ